LRPPTPAAALTGRLRNQGPTEGQPNAPARSPNGCLDRKLLQSPWEQLPPGLPARQPMCLLLVWFDPEKTALFSPRAGAASWIPTKPESWWSGCSGLGTEPQSTHPRQAAPKLEGSIADLQGPAARPMASGGRADTAAHGRGQGPYPPASPEIPFGIGPLAAQGQIWIPLGAALRRSTCLSPFPVRTTLW